MTLDCTCQENSAAVGAEQYSFFGGFDDGELELDGGLEVLAYCSTPPSPITCMLRSATGWHIQ